MSMRSPDRIELTDPERADLARLVRAGRTEQQLAVRAQIVLGAADGHPNTSIASVPQRLHQPRRGHHPPTSKSATTRQRELQLTPTGWLAT
ncbi:MAG: hypothetical protein M3Y35_05585 [Actinomycetota bacterium]|nr:hypothetical protein [Actinomycetota bacterium]